MITREERESMRLQAAKMFGAGKTQADAVHRFKVSRTTASRWYRVWNSSGSDALRSTKATGRPSMVDIDDIDQFMATVNMDGQTTASLAVVIDVRFGVAYDQDHVCRILHRIGFKKSGGRWVKNA